MNDTWRVIPGFDGKYELNLDGQVRSVPRKTSRMSSTGKLQELQISGKLIMPVDIPHRTKTYVLKDTAGNSISLSVPKLLRTVFPEYPQFQPGYSNVESLPGEIWKFAGDPFPDFVQVSNMGRVQTLNRYAVISDEFPKRLIRGKLLVPMKDYKYPTIRIPSSRANKGYPIARLVANAFVCVPEGKIADELDIGYVDGDPQNVTAFNLYWKEPLMNTKED